MLKTIERINSLLEKQDYCTLQEAKTNIDGKLSGFYWIYTKLPLASFIKAPKPINPKHVDLSLMANTHQNLKWITKQNGSEYWCIYNGKGERLNKRMTAAFTNSDGETGTTALMRCFEENDFKVKYIICSSVNSSHGVKEEYSSLERDLERVWRLNYTWPFLCRT